MAAAPATRARRGADPGEEGALVGEREARVGLGAVGVDAARPAVLGVVHRAIIPAAGRRGRRPCRGRARWRGRRTRRGRAGVARRWSRAPRSPRAVVMTAAQWSRPMRHRVARERRRRRPAREPRVRRARAACQDAPDDLGADVRQVDEGDEREVVVARPEVGQPGPQRGAHPLVPVVGVHDLGPRALDERRDLVAGSADDDDHAVAPARRSPGPRPSPRGSGPRRRAARGPSGRPSVGRPRRRARARRWSWRQPATRAPDEFGWRRRARGSWVFG